MAVVQGLVAFLRKLLSCTYLVLNHRVASSMHVHQVNGDSMRLEGKMLQRKEMYMKVNIPEPLIDAKGRGP